MTRTNELGKWTRGTWEIVGAPEENYLGRIVADGRRDVVAELPQYVREDERRANARLIASAPDLVNALQLAEATIVRLERHAPGSANGTLDVVRAALARAEGRE